MIIWEEYERALAVRRVERRVSEWLALGSIGRERPAVTAGAWRLRVNAAWVEWMQRPRVVDLGLWTPSDGELEH